MYQKHVSYLFGTSPSSLSSSTTETPTSTIIPGAYASTTSSSTGHVIAPTTLAPRDATHATACTTHAAVGTTTIPAPAIPVSPGIAGISGSPVLPRKPGSSTIPVSPVLILGKLNGNLGELKEVEQEFLALEEIL